MMTSWIRRVGRTTWRRARGRGAQARWRPTGVDNHHHHLHHLRHDHLPDHLVIDLMSISNSTEMSDSSTRGSPMQTSSPPPCLDHTYYSIQVSIAIISYVLSHAQCHHPTHLDLGFHRTRAPTEECPTTTRWSRLHPSSPSSPHPSPDQP